MNSLSKRVLGIVLILISVLALPVALYQISRVESVGLPPCVDAQMPQQEINPDVRIVYCIGVWHFHSIRGYGTYAEGTSNKDEIKVRDLNFRRDEQTLYVNNSPILSGEVYSTILWNAFSNPWLIFMNRCKIKNEGLTSIGSSAPSKALYVSGDVIEEWFPNPLGLIILGSGSWLFKQGRKRIIN